MKMLPTISACLIACALLLSPTHVRADRQGLDISKVRLNLAFQPGPRTAGQLFLRGITDDNDTEGLVADLRTNTVTLQVQDGGDFDHTTTLEACEHRATDVYCKATCRASA
ncbi:MAG: hypothetical protein P8R42_09605 [Candidatus Binatia bacterium]|nr:hypothetical protein [Candidatus Binatia bacterium]